MEPSSSTILFEVLPIIRIYKDGSVERLLGTATVPPNPSPDGLVVSKDVTFNAQEGVFVRLHIPQSLESTQPQKVPVIVYIHGGGFCIESAASPLYHTYVGSLAKEAHAVCVSVNYRRTPEHRLPAAYDDCLSVLQWLDSHGREGEGSGLDPWIKSYADLSRVFLAGDSAGGNMVHQMGVIAYEEKWGCLRLEGGIFVHPFFGGEEAIECEIRADGAGFVRHCDDIWKFSMPEEKGVDKDHPFLNPQGPRSPPLWKIAYNRIIVFVAEKDFLKDRGLMYYEGLKKAGKHVEVVVTEGENHVFHLLKPQSEKAAIMMKQICDFVNSSVAV